LIYGLKPWLRLERREAAHENCRVDMLAFLQGLAVGSLLLFDLGYFSFSFFDTLTQWKLWWVSRYRKNTSYRIARSSMLSSGWGPAKSKRGTWCG
jgi:hypothetical protein